MSACPACGQEIRWARTDTGKRISLDAHPEGNLVLSGDELLPTARSVSRAEIDLEQPRYRNHVKTCPQVGRRKKQPRPAPGPVLFEEPHQ
jgi:hypothetical protein